MNRRGFIGRTLGLLAAACAWPGTLLARPQPVVNPFTPDWLRLPKEFDTCLYLNFHSVTRDGGKSIRVDVTAQFADDRHLMTSGWTHYPASLGHKRVVAGKGSVRYSCEPCQIVIDHGNCVRWIADYVRL